MNNNEEMVYSIMGLNPILLLKEPPIHENYSVNIIRPGEEEGLEEVKNEKDIIHPQNKNTIQQDSTNPEATENIKKEAINVDLDQEKNDLTSAEKNSINEKNESNNSETKDADEDPRRKRRRSSASS